MQARNKLPFMNTARADSTLERLRIRLLQFILVFLFILALTFIISILSNSGNFLTGASIIPPVTAVVSIMFFFLIGQRRFIKVTSIVVISFVIFISAYLFVLTDDISVMFVTLTLSAIASALLFGRFNFLVFSLLTLALILGVSFLDVIRDNGWVRSSIPLFLITTTFGLIPITISSFARFFIVELEQTAEQAQRSLSLLEANADIGRNISEMTSLNELLNGAVDIIRDRFAFYHVGIFLSDETNRYSHLVASTGEVGERMLARGHRLPISANSVVGRSTQAQDIIVMRDSRHAYNELLPDTRSELAVPIADAQGVIGVVDIQSRRIDAFTETEIEALRFIANQLATAIRNTRLIEEQEQSIGENQRLFTEAETNLREIQRLNRQLTKQAWSDYLQANRRIDGVTLSDSGFRNRAEWSDEMLTASQKRRAITEDKNGTRTIAVPIELRGEVVGAIELETNPNKNSDDVIEMVQTISQRLGVSLDNARLFEESNEATAQEQRIGEIVSQYQSANSVDELLRLTIKGLAETLGADQASIRLGVVPDIASADDNLPPSENGGSAI